MYEITYYNGETDQTVATCKVNSAQAARELADALNADRTPGSCDWYSVRTA